MTHPFRDSYIKLSRAKAHLADLERIQTAWSDSTPGGQQIGPNESFLSTRSMPVPEEVGAVVGDVVHNLRAALDLMAVALVRAKGGNTKNVYFPFADSAENLPARIKDKNFHRAGNEAVKLLEEIAPYSGGNVALRELHNLDLQDKHHALIVHAITITTATVQVHVDETTGKVSLVPVDGSRPSAALVFPEDSVFATEEIVPVLHKLVETTAGIIKAFEALCEVDGVGVDAAGAQEKPALPAEPEAPTSKA
ncbi:MAG: hypothetical protein R3C27_15095 [Hyphomonadaceae bacterium]